MHILGFQKTTLLDYPEHLASTIFTGGCNFRCPYCHNGDLVLTPNALDAFSEEEIFSTLESRKNLIDGVCITGGEPTLQADLKDFILKVRSLGLLVKLDTNGSRPDILKNLLDEGLLDCVAMDIKHCPDKYNEIACMKGFDLSNIKESVNLLKASSIDYEFRTTLCKEVHSLDDITKIGEWLQGAKKYYLQVYKQTDQVIDPRFSAPSDDDLDSFINVLKEYIPAVSIRGVD